MFTLSPSNQATVDQKQIATMLFRLASVHMCTAAAWHTDGLKCPGLDNNGPVCCQSSLEAHLEDFGMHSQNLRGSNKFGKQ